MISTATQRNDIVITWNDHWRPTNLVQPPAGDDNGGYATNFTDVNSMIIIKGRGDQTTNLTDSGGATNVPSRYYRVRLSP